MNRILIADDDESILWILERFLKEKGHDVITTSDGNTAIGLIRGGGFSTAIIDIRMPGKDGFEVLQEIGSVVPVIIMTAQGTMKNAIEAMKKGAFDYITKPFDLDEVEVIVEKALENKRLKEEVSQLKGRLKERLAKETTIIGKSKAMQGIFKTIGKIAQRDVTVLIQGESGTGKELVARVIHLNSPGGDGPFIALNSAAIPKELMESELFGHERGAFTGAVEERPGKFELAQGGTLFLDEIGDMSMDVQSKILRAIQEKEFYRVGGKKPIKVDVRLIAASNQDLQKAVEERRFRDDLLYRLNVVSIRIPPLRERVEDIPLLADYLLQRSHEEIGLEPKTLSKGAIEVLKGYSWPGNVRELENVLRRASILSPNPVITAEDLSLPRGEVIKKEPLEGLIATRLEGFIERLEGRQELYATMLPFMERPLIRLVLKKTKGNQVKAAELLGINRNTLRKKIKELGIGVKGSE